MWKNLQSLRVDGHRAFVQVAKEKLQRKYVSQGCKGFIDICFSCSEYVSCIETPTGVHVTVRNEVELPCKDTRYMKRMFAKETLYATGKPRFKSIMLQGGKNRDGVTYQKLWIVIKLGSLSMKYNAMMRPNSYQFMSYN